jgi:hypothetical protein
MKNLMPILSVLAAIAAGLIFFWPTPYRYEDGGLVRINRFTGTVQKAGGGGWEIAQPTESADKLDPITPEITKAFEAVTVAAQDFESITLHNPGPWSLTLIEKAEVAFDSACGAGASDYISFNTAERTLNPNADAAVRLPYSERFKKSLTTACGNGSHKRTLTLILNSGYSPDGKRWDAQSRLVTRKIEGEVAVPAS